MVVIAKTLIMQSWLRRNPIYIIIKSAHNKLLPVKVHYVITSFNYTVLIEIATFQYNFYFIILKTKISLIIQLVQLLDGLLHQVYF